MRAWAWHVNLCSMSQIPLDQFPHNFPIANVMGKSPTC